MRICQATFFIPPVHGVNNISRLCTWSAKKNTYWVPEKQNSLENADNAKRGNNPLVFKKLIVGGSKIVKIRTIFCSKTNTINAWIFEKYVWTYHTYVWY